LNFSFSFRFVDENYRIFVIVVVFVTKINLFSSTKIIVFVVVDENNTGLRTIYDALYKSTHHHHHHHHHHHDIGDALHQLNANQQYLKYSTHSVTGIQLISLLLLHPFDGLFVLSHYVARFTCKVDCTAYLHRNAAVQHLFMVPAPRTFPDLLRVHLKSIQHHHEGGEATESRLFLCTKL